MRKEIERPPKPLVNRHTEKEVQDVFKDRTNV